VEFQLSSDTGGEQRVRQLGLEPFHYLLFAGRLVPEKRIGDIIRAVCRGTNPYCLAIAGEGAQDHLKLLKMNVAGDRRIRFLGHHDPRTIRSLMRYSLGFISASELEGFSMALLECVAEAAPAIVSDIAPHRELFGSYPAYDMFSPRGDIDALAARINSLANAPNTFRERALRIRTSIARQFPVQRMIDQTESVLNSAALRFSMRPRTANGLPRQLS
jgi:glycosyltransferase involved in cell wall biosynthesis